MKKKGHRKGLLFYLGHTMAALGIALLLLLLAIYLAVPTYQFDEPEPFGGKFLYNPYQDLNHDLWKKYNFHCHSRKHLGLTNGRHSKETKIDSVYSMLGYDHYGISDYMFINKHNADSEDYIPAYEHGYGLFRKTHQLCIGAEKVNYIDYPFMQNLSMKQYVINRLNTATRFVVPAHASFTKGYKVNDMKYLSNYRLIEVLNPYGDGLEHWDMALSNGHRVYCIGNDDTHNINNEKEVCRYFTQINVPDMKSEHVYEALEKGQCYTVEFLNWHYYPKPLDTKANDLKTLDHLTKAQLVGDTLFIQTSAKKMNEVTFIGQDGKTLKTMQNVEEAYYVITPEDTYVRTKIDLNGKQLLYLNPVTRHLSQAMMNDKRLDSINIAQTALYWLVYLVAVVAMTRYVILKTKARKKQESNESQRN